MADDFFDSDDGGGGDPSSLLPIVEVPSSHNSVSGSAQSTARNDPDDENNYSDNSFEDASLEEDDNDTVSIPTETPREKKDSKEKKRKKKSKSRSHVNMTEPDVLLKKSEKKARHYSKHKKVDKAIHEYVRCLALVRIVYGDGHWKLAQAHANLAQGYLELKNYVAQANYHGDIAKGIMMGRLQMTSSSTDKGNIMEVLVLIYYILGKALTALKNILSEASQALSKAEVLANERAKEANVSESSIEDWDIKIALAMARLNIKQQKHALAIEYFEKALGLLEVKFGEDSVELIPVYQGMGKVEQSKGKHADHEKAIQDYLQAHSIASAQYDAGSVEVADTARALATAYSNAATDEAETSAESYLNECITIYQIHYGPEHAKTLDAQDELARLMIRMDRSEEALDMLKSTLEAKKEVYGEFSPKVAETWKLIGSVYLSQENPEKAAKALTKCYDMECLVHGANNIRSKNTKSTLDILMSNPAVAAKVKGQKGGKLSERPVFNSIVSRSSTIGFKSGF